MTAWWQVINVRNARMAQSAPPGCLSVNNYSLSEIQIPPNNFERDREIEKEKIFDPLNAKSFSDSPGDKILRIFSNFLSGRISGGPGWNSVRAKINSEH